MKYEQFSIFETPQKGIEKKVSVQSPPAAHKKRDASTNTYKEFYSAAKRIDLRVGEKSDAKRKILEMYFPARFGKRGNQPAHSRGNYSIGATFLHVMSYATKRMRE